MAHPDRQSLVSTGDVDCGAAIRQHTKRNNGRSLGMIMRVRSILRKRDNRKGRGRGLDHQRYPNAYLIRAGLTFLITVTHPGHPVPAKT